MLVIAASHIPPQGMDLHVELSAGGLQLEAEESFAFEAGTLRSTLERADDESVHVRGRLTARLGLQCGRCLEDFTLPVEQEIDLFYLPRSANQFEEEEEVELKDRDVVVAYYDQDRLELGNALREQLLLTVPMKRLCREDCKGLCASCGRNLNVEDCGCSREGLDPRLAPLGHLFERSRQGYS